MGDLGLDRISDISNITQVAVKSEVRDDDYCSSVSSDQVPQSTQNCNSSMLNGSQMSTTKEEVEMEENDACVESTITTSGTSNGTSRIGSDQNRVPLHDAITEINYMEVDQNQQSACQYIVNQIGETYQNYADLPCSSKHLESQCEQMEEQNELQQESQFHHQNEEYKISIPTISDFIKYSSGSMVKIIYPTHHQVDMNQPESVSNPAMRFQFNLKNYQMTAIDCLHNEDKFVVASLPEGSGKSLIAIYAIALALRNHKKVIYVTPSKELAVMKYQYFSGIFTSVELVTCLDQENRSDCLIMTTQMLLQIMYQAKNDSHWGYVIFDDMHLHIDRSFGTLEETIILLPKSVQPLFLLSPAKNAEEIAQWVVTLRDKPCYYLYVENSPVLLRHFMYGPDSSKLFEVVNAEGNFDASRFEQAISSYNESLMATYDSREKSEFVVQSILRTLKERHSLPCIIYTTNPEQCEIYANTLRSLDFNSEDEKQRIKNIYRTSISSLSEDNKRLPPILNLIPYIMRGIGVFHNGLLPIVKQIVEELFAEGLLKVLIGTEDIVYRTEVRAHAVVLTSLRKIIGETSRYITASEYSQMTGRARNFNDNRGPGLSIILIDESIEKESLQKIVKKNDEPLNSQFLLNFNMVLNHIHLSSTQTLINSSFICHQNAQLQCKLEKEREEKFREYKTLSRDLENEVYSFKSLAEQIKQLRQSINMDCMKPEKIMKFLNPGRIVEVSWNGLNFGWGALVKIELKDNLCDQTSGSPVSVAHVALEVCKESVKNSLSISQIKPAPEESKRVLNSFGGQSNQNAGSNLAIEILPISIECITAISIARIKLPDNLNTHASIQCLRHCLTNIRMRYNGDVPELDPFDDLEIENAENLRLKYDALKEKRQEYERHPLQTRNDVNELQDNFNKQWDTNNEIALLDTKIANAKTKGSLISTDFRNYVELLLDTEYLQRSSNGESDVLVLDEKGRFARTIYVADCVLLTEMLMTPDPTSFSDPVRAFPQNPVPAISQLNPAEIVALLSCLVFKKQASEAILQQTQERLLMIKGKFLDDIAGVILSAATNRGINLSRSYIKSNSNPGMMQIVYDWCSGIKFGVILERYPSVYEGTIVDCLISLDELLHEIMNSLKNTQIDMLKGLVQKFNMASKQLRRDIILTPSLYM